ncbi:MAG: leucyl/phenylalanyl-tRNA--protein transferase [Gammaproteobacteria bacterium]
MSEINLPWLDSNNSESPFPPAESALKDPEGLVAAGGDLKPDRILRAYHEGLFPWYEEDQPILWWSPNPRGVLYPKDFIAHKSLLRTIKKNRWQISYDQSFLEVMKACAEPRNNSRGTWITDDMVEAYVNLHRLNHAHSLEVCDEAGELIGGVYGISIGTIFFGESMFSRVNNASKVALLYLSAYLDSWGYNIIDTQLPSAHLKSLGGSEITRDRYLSLLPIFTSQSCASTAWQSANIDIYHWLNQP